jgi:hypothetical protein
VICAVHRSPYSDLPASTSSRSLPSPVFSSYLLLPFLLPLLRLPFLLLYLACDETAVMADINVLSSSEDTQFDDSEAPHTTIPHLIPYLIPFPHTLLLIHTDRFLESGSEIPQFPMPLTSSSTPLHPTPISPFSCLFTHTSVHTLRFATPAHISLHIRTVTAKLYLPSYALQIYNPNTHQVDLTKKLS